MLKMTLLDCAINEKCCSVDGGRGICPLFSSPPPGLPSKAKKMLYPGGQPRGGQHELTDALQPWRFNMSILLHLHSFIGQISLETKMSPLIPQMLASLGTLFILTIKIFEA